MTSLSLTLQKGKVLRLRKVKTKKDKTPKAHIPEALEAEGSSSAPLQLSQVSDSSTGDASKPKKASGPLSQSERRLWSTVPEMAGVHDTYGVMQTYANSIMTPLLGSDLVEFGVSNQDQLFLQASSHLR